MGTSQSDESEDHNEEGLKKYFCAWCQRTKLCAHTSNLENEVNSLNLFNLKLM